MVTIDDLVNIDHNVWEIPKSHRHDMRVPARILASSSMLDEICRDRSLEQIVNVATLPGIVRHAIVMPDMHEGYGFPIGGVAAFEVHRGIISPGGIGYDINCGVRLLRSDKTIAEMRPYLEKVAHAIYQEVPSGVGRGGRLKLKNKDLDYVLMHGAQQMVEAGFGKREDLQQLESGGRLSEADSSLVSEHAKDRGRDQLGTMGAGNHFVEVEYIDAIFDPHEAQRLGVCMNQVVILIHTGSRGLGHQIATDYIRVMMKAMPRYKIVLPDRELACVPFQSKEGQQYFRAMSAGANFAWANRQLITWEVRQAWQEVLGDAGGTLEIVYDVAHNIAKIENNLVVHRKGATRAFPRQPVLIPGSMGSGSYILKGEEKAMVESFASSCHGAGRRMSRTQAKRQIKGAALKEELLRKGIFVAAGSVGGLAEEAPEAYKNLDEVVTVIHEAGIATKVAHARPVAVIKG
ncbi:MAG: RtcB family protein [Patescibacteria group bacterium]